jgi:hypothetical protein
MFKTKLKRKHFFIIIISIFIITITLNYINITKTENINKKNELYKKYLLEKKYTFKPKEEEKWFTEGINNELFFDFQKIDFLKKRRILEDSKISTRKILKKRTPSNPIIVNLQNSKWYETDFLNHNFVKNCKIPCKFINNKNISFSDLVLEMDKPPKNLNSLKRKYKNVKFGMVITLFNHR